MGPREKEAILRDVASALDSEELNGEEIDSIDLVDGELLISTESTRFALKVEEV